MSIKIITVIVLAILIVCGFYLLTKNTAEAPVGETENILQS